MSQHTFSLRLLHADDYPAAIRICASAMRDNPLHIRVFGSNAELRERRLRRFFPGLFHYLISKGQLYGALHDNQLVGVLGMLPPNHCQPSLREVIRMLPGLCSSNSLLGTARTLYWLARWARLDPATPHWHLGPLAVDPAWQGHGAGRQLMQFACQHGGNDLLYLETDKPENAAFYQSLGFVTVKTVDILGCQCWLMTHRQIPAAPASRSAIKY